ncbi:MAG: hydrogenase iron-sulfur subunit [Actinomycetota bacterium]|nr:hydrogenase iron-sulfur subunit [Actinomycetota bacterium]
MTDADHPDGGDHRRIDGLARVSFAVEAPVRKAVGSGRLNPLPHAGTISVVLMFVVVVTGLYITLFFEFGFEASYRAVTKLTDHPIQRLMRSLHRYSSAALVLTTLVHAWRIFVASRFNGPRRWPWLTGWVALVIVFLAGVTGYWILWDERAQLINEATASVLSVFGAGETLVASILTTDGTGWQVLLLLWLAHILTTVLIGYFLWRHLRRAKLPWLPPRLWTGLMIAALLVVSVVFPAELLGPADPSVLVDEVPIDPFFLFLLPGLAKLPGWAVLVGFFALTGFLAYLPWLLDRGKHEVVTIDADNCVGCELCVIDCPYKALTMVGHGESSIAEVDPEACVACGICIGSCVFDAIDLPGATIPTDVDVEGRDVVLACDRHRCEQYADVEIIKVRCVGMISPTAIAGLTKAGAESVQIVGCAPGDCAYGVGNKLAEERLEGERRPRVPKAAAAATTRDFVAPTALKHAIAAPGTHLSADPGVVPKARGRIGVAAAVVLVSMLLVGLATTVVFTVDRPESGVLVVVHHEPGAVVVGTDAPAGSPGTPTILRTQIGDAASQEQQIGGGGLATAVVPLEASSGDTYVLVELVEGDVTTVIHDGVVSLEQGRRLVLTVKDEGAVDANTGEGIFVSSKAGCTICHSVTPGIVLVGPNLSAIGADAGTRVEGLSAEEYLRQSIIDPDAYVVEGFPAGQMLDNFEEKLSSDEIDALIAYLMTLQG